MSVFSFSDLAFMGAVSGGIPGFDPDASSYILSVEAADGQQLESGVREAINDFVVGCKADGIWNAIKASCIMAGARTLAGALTPLVGTAPTNFNFVDGDYNRKTGLVGNGSTKYLNSNRNNNADPQNSRHLCGYMTTAPTNINQAFGGSGTSATGGRSLIWRGGQTGNDLIFASAQNTAFPVRAFPSMPTFIGMSRSSSTLTILRSGGGQSTDNTSSKTPTSDSISIFAYTAPTVGFYSNARLAFYSIGEALDLALLDARVTALINDFAAAIP